MHGLINDSVNRQIFLAYVERLLVPAWARAIVRVRQA